MTTERDIPDWVLDEIPECADGYIPDWLDDIEEEGRRMEEEYAARTYELGK